MSAHPANIPELDRKGLREFGLLMAAVIGVLFGLFFPWLFDHGWPSWPWIISVAFALPALVVPTALRPVYRGWMRFGLFMSRIMTPLVLGIVFFLVFTPVALGLKLLGKDAMRRKLDPQADSYRIDNRDTTMGDMERPF
jgi:O-antigen/teichoic acid export membrane protein